MEETKKFREQVVEALRQNKWLDETKDGVFEYEIYADYRDEISEQSIIEICQSEAPEMEFESWMYEGYFDYMLDLRAELEGDVKRRMESVYPDGLSDEQEEKLECILTEKIFFTYPRDHYLNQPVPVDIFVDTGDMNYDFTLNYRCPMWGAEADTEIDPKASIRWLAGQQGYSEPVLREYLRGDNDESNPNGFLETLYAEMLNTPSQMPTLVFLAEMTVKDLIHLNQTIREAQGEGGRWAYEPGQRPDCGCIRIQKDAKTGLYDSWDGGGGPFEIALEKGVLLPIKYIHSALPDVKGACGRWSVGETYGICRSAWRDVVSFPDDAA